MCARTAPESLLVSLYHPLCALTVSLQIPLSRSLIILSTHSTMINVCIIDDSVNNMTSKMVQLAWNVHAYAVSPSVRVLKAS